MITLIITAATIELNPLDRLRSSEHSHFLNHLAITASNATNTKYRVSGVITSHNRAVSIMLYH